LQVLLPMRWECFIALPLQHVSMYLAFCVLANWLSIFAPLRVPAGALRKAKPTVATLALHLLVMFVLFPCAMAPALLPWGVERLFELLGAPTKWPVCLLLSVVVCAIMVFVYQRALRWEGRLLQGREQAIYAAVRTKDE
jgi:hypothetical protein